MTPTVRIAGPDHIVNTSGVGFVIYAEWSFMDEGQRRTTHQVLDGAFSMEYARRAKAWWTEALS